MYKNKIENYESDCPMHLGSKTHFNDYLKEWAQVQTGSGLDLGAGPQGPYAHYF